MPFGRSGKQSNRSQHALPILDPPTNPSAGGPAGGNPAPEGAREPVSATNTPHSASSSTHESFDARSQLHPKPQRQHSYQQQQQQQQPPPPPPPQHQESQQPLQPPPHGYGQASPPLASPGPAADYADLVSRSQSQRFPAPPLQTHYQTGAASSSADDLVHTTSPSPSHSHPQGIPSPPGIQYQHTLPHAPPPEQKRSTRKLIKGIFSSGSRTADHHNQAQQGHYDNTSGLARRPSKRVGNNSTSPNVRGSLSHLSQLSQLSLDQDRDSASAAANPHDWQTQPSLSLHSQQQSPLPGVGEVDERHYRRDSNVELHLQTQSQDQPINPGNPSHPTIRPVRPADELGFPQDSQQHHFNQGGFDQQQYQFSSPPSQDQYHQPGLPQLHTSHLTATPQHQNPETSSQVSRESPDSDPPSTHFQSAQVSPSATFGNTTQESALPPLPPEAHQEAAQQAQMAPGGQPIRRPQDTDKGRSHDNQTGAPPPYRQINAMPPPPGQANQQNTAFRGAGSQDRLPYDGSSGGDPGRNSPQPSTLDPRDNDPEKAKVEMKEILTKYKNVKRLYFDGKAQIEQMTAQIEQLQNAVANQRMSQSRTSLDDSEYSTRFNRLNGAINNLSFNIRKDWRQVPEWIACYVTEDALKTGKQEMTAAGRAFITRWIVDNLFNKCFHPGLEPTLSEQLKEIEMNIRRFSYTLSSQEEYDALTTKVVNWRMATLEGLSPMLSSGDSARHRADFTNKMATNLTANLYKYMNEPPPAGVDGSATMIVELAIGIAANLPLESRDVAIVYPLPQETIQTRIMELEKTPLPPLDGAKGDGDGDSGDEKAKSKDRRDRNKSTPSQVPPPKDASKVRLSGFVAVEVRGRQVLMKAPIWALG